MNKLLPSKTVPETITLTFNFRDQVPFGVTLSAPVCTVEVFTGVDSDPSVILVGSATVDTTTAIVTQQITAGMPGCVYYIICSITGSDSCTYKLKELQVVLTDVGASFRPGIGLYITGDYPDTYAYIDYYEVLNIHEGYEPYGPVSVYSGNFPIGWTLTIFNKWIVASGIANDTGTFTFRVKLFDWAGQIAYSDQVVYIPPVDLYGSIPTTGVVGEPYTGTFNTRYGMTPYVNYATTGGTVPPGISIPNSAVATYSGTPTTRGVYTFDTTVTDSISETDTEPAIITIYPPKGFVAAGFVEKVMISANGQTWIDATTGLTNTTNNYVCASISRFFLTTNTITPVAGGVYLSDDSGTTWFPATTYTATLGVANIDYGNGIGVIVGAKASKFAVARSTDNGVTWADVVTNVDGLISVALIADFQFGGGLFVVSIYEGGVNSRVMTTPDGVTWTTISSSYGGGGNGYNGSHFMAIDVGGIHSTNGVSWTTNTNNPGTSGAMTSVMGGSGYFCAGNNGSVQGIFRTDSTASIPWTLVKSGTLGSLGSHAQTATMLIMCSVEGATNSYYSNDSGVTWTAMSPSFTCQDVASNYQLP